MKLAQQMLAVAIALTIALAAGTTSGLAAKKKKKKCKDGETAKIASYEITKGKNIDRQIKDSLTGKAGDAKAGLKWMTHRRLGNCIACHEVTKILKKADASDLNSLRTYGFHGKIAPTLDGIADRFTEGELRLIVVSAKTAFPDNNTIMPAFHAASGFNRVIGDCKDLAILSAERVEDVIAYLRTLKE
ncbi:MAG: c-type cytochrome [Methyloligellaceae bacterium]